LALARQDLFGHALDQDDRLLPDGDKRLRRLRRQARQAGFSTQTAFQLLSPLV
jgi:hypothetical protein